MNRLRYNSGKAEENNSPVYDSAKETALSELEREFIEREMGYEN